MTNTEKYTSLIRRFAAPQVQTVLDHMVKYGSISGNKAQDYRIRSLSRRINDMEEIIRFVGAPLKVRREWKRDLMGQRYVEYTIVDRSAA